eukprot:6118915-Pyramimonas_sp.AAC.1
MLPQITPSSTSSLRTSLSNFITPLATVPPLWESERPAGVLSSRKGGGAVPPSSAMSARNLPHSSISVLTDHYRHTQ